jgi:hypothetical protein
MSIALFGLGKLAATPGALDDLRANGQAATELIKRHRAGDFGEVSEGDAAANRQDIADGIGRVLSAYTLPDGSRLWVITNIVDGEGTDTCVLRPDEY